MASYQNHLLSKKIQSCILFFTRQQNISSKYNFLSTIFLFNKIFSSWYHHQLFMLFLSLLNAAFLKKNNPFITFKLERSCFFVARVKFLHNNPIAHTFFSSSIIWEKTQNFSFFGALFAFFYEINYDATTKAL